MLLGGLSNGYSGAITGGAVSRLKPELRMTALQEALKPIFYIGKDGRILFIDRDVRPAQSAQDMAAKLEELGVPARAAS
mgnify:CR=1 FL=1